MVSLTLGLGLATALFSVLDQFVYQRPYPEFDRLVALGTEYKTYGFMSFAIGDRLLPCLEQGQCFEASAIWTSYREVLDTGQESLGVEVSKTNPDYFPVLGGKASLGRLFGPDDYKDGADGVAVLHYVFWQKAFASDSGVIGRNVRLDGKPFRIIGVLEPNFMRPSTGGATVFTPIRFKGSERYNVSAFARMKHGTTLSQADAEVRRLAPAGDFLPEVFEDPYRVPIRPKPLSVINKLDNRKQLLVVFCSAVVLIFAIGFLNALHLMLLRLSGRWRELGIRMALGASARSLLGLLSLESVLLMLGSGLLGLALAYGLIPVLMNSLAPARSAFEPAVVLDLRAFLFMFILGLATAGILTVLSGWRVVRMSPDKILKEDGIASGEGKRGRRFREVLVVSNAALALLLLVGTGLMTRSIQRLTATDRGFHLSGSVGVHLTLPEDAFDSGPWEQLALRFESRLKQVPGVQDVGFTTCVPMTGLAGGEVMKPDGSPMLAWGNPVSPAYGKALGIRLLKGRWLPDRSEGIHNVVVFSRSMAREYAGTEDCIGRSVSLFGGTISPWQVIGLVDDVKGALRTQEFPQFYYPPSQFPMTGRDMGLVISTDRKVAGASIYEIRRALHDTEPRAGITSADELEELARQQAVKERTVASLLQVISLVATGLALTGLFSVMAYGVQKREREFGLRMALGASPRRLFVAVMQRGLVLGLLGVAAGLFGAWALTRFLTSLLYETSPLEPSVFACMALMLLGALLLAAVPPAWRAARLAPARLMRDE